MTTTTLFKAAGCWMVILVLAMLNGTLREFVWIPTFGPFAGQMMSGLLLMFGIFVVAWIAVPWIGQQTNRRWFGMGLFWLALTLLFEFGFGHFVQHKTWAELLSAYTFRGGNLWPLVLLATLLSPWLAARLRGQT